MVLCNKPLSASNLCTYPAGNPEDNLTSKASTILFYRGDVPVDNLTDSYACKQLGHHNLTSSRGCHENLFLGIQFNSNKMVPQCQFT